MEPTNIPTDDVVYVQNLMPPVKDQIIATALGIGATLVVTGIFVGSVTLIEAVSKKINERRARKEELKNIFITPEKD